MKVLKDYGVVADHGSKVLKLQKTKDNALSLVSYKDGMSVNALDITVEAKALKELLEGYLGYKTAKIDATSDVIHSLVSLPAGDNNYEGALDKATRDDLEQALTIMRSNGGKNVMRIKACEQALKKVGNTTKAKTKTNTPKAKPKDATGMVRENLV